MNTEQNSKKIGIMGWFWVPNRGAILTNWALNEFLKTEKYDVETINFIPNGFKEKEYKKNISENFATKYLNLSPVVTNYRELKYLNSRYDTFITGSDQLWRWKFRKFPSGHLFLNFVEERNKKISYSTSFGVGIFEGPEIDALKISYWLSRFDNISVRENDGVTLLQDKFNISGTQVLDPVFLIDKSKYEDLINKIKCKEKDFIAYYFIANTEKKLKIVNEIAKKYATEKIIDLKQDSSVEEWLYLIKNAKYIICDSFHATCFAIIFNKSFIVINPITEKNSRFETILSKTNLAERFIEKPEDFDINNEIFFQDINWQNVHENLNAAIEQSKNWLLTALKKPAKKMTNIQKISDALLEEIDCLHQQNLCTKKRIDEIKLIFNEERILKKYYRYNFLAKISFGKMRKHYKEKSKIFHEKVGKIRELKSNL